MPMIRQLLAHARAWLCAGAAVALIAWLGGCARFTNSISDLNPSGGRKQGAWYDIEIVKEPTEANPKLTFRVLNYREVSYTGRVGAGVSDSFQAVMEHPESSPNTPIVVTVDGHGSHRTKSDDHGKATVDLVNHLDMDFFPQDGVIAITIAVPDHATSQYRYSPREFLHAYYFFRDPSQMTRRIPLRGADAVAHARTEPGRLYPIAEITEDGQYVISPLGASTSSSLIEPISATSATLIGYAASETVALAHASSGLEVDLRFAGADGDGLLTGGEEGALHVTVRNRGPRPAVNTSVTLGERRTPRGLRYATQVQLDAIAPGESAERSVSVTAADDIPTGFGWITATVVAGEDSAQQETPIRTRRLEKAELRLAGIEIEGQGTSEGLRAGGVYRVNVRVANAGNAPTTPVALHVGTAEPDENAPTSPGTAVLDLASETPVAAISVGVIRAEGNRDVAFDLAIPEAFGARAATLHVAARCCDGLSAAQAHEFTTREAPRPVLAISHEVTGGLREDAAARLGEPVEIRIAISNQGDAISETVGVTVRPGVSDATPQNFGLTLEGIAPGERRQFTTTVEPGAGFMDAGVLEQVIPVLIEASGQRGGPAQSELQILVRRPRPAEIQVVEVLEDGKLLLDAGRAEGMDEGLKAEVYFDLGVIAEIELEAAEMNQAVAFVTSPDGASKPQKGDLVRIVSD